MKKHILGVIGGTALLLVGCAGTRPVATEPANGPDEEQAKTTIEAGYGTQDKDDVTGATASVDVDQAMKEQSPATVAEILRGRVSGVHVSEGPGGGLKVRIRGEHSLSGGGDPLYVIDGMPVQPEPGGSIPFLNPHDIKSITVLKDAAATAIYGSSGANGVIVITTKDQ